MNNGIYNKQKYPKIRKRLTGYRKWEKDTFRNDKTSSLGSILHQLIDFLDISDLLAEQQAIIMWSTIVGDTIASVTAAKTIKNGTLNVIVSNSTWRQELNYMKDDIIYKLNRGIGKPIVKDIRFK